MRMCLLYLLDSLWPHCCCMRLDKPVEIRSLSTPIIPTLLFTCKSVNLGLVDLYSSDTSRQKSSIKERVVVAGQVFLYETMLLISITIPSPSKTAPVGNAPSEEAQGHWSQGDHKTFLRAPQCTCGACTWAILYYTILSCAQRRSYAEQDLWQAIFQPKRHI